MPGDLVGRFKLLVAANCDQSVSPAARTVLSQILDHYNSRTGQCTPSLERLAQTTNLSRRSVIRGVNELVAAGWIRRDRSNREGSRSFLTNSFHPAFERAPSGPEVVTGLSPPSDDPDTRGSDSADTRGGDNPDTEVVTGLSPKPSKRTKEGRTKSVSVTPAEFEAWWSLYPRKVAKDAARKAFDKALATGRATLVELMAGVRRLAAEREGQDQKYTPHAATWLNEGRWCDEPAPPHRAAPNGRQPFSALDRLRENLRDDD